MGEVMQKKIEVHTTDRILFRRCRRKWNWASPIREHLVPIGEINSALWFGTGIHFALEDFHGRKRFSYPSDAFTAYINAHKENELPIDASELHYLATEMLDYYANFWVDVYFSAYRTATLYDIAQLGNGHLHPQVAKQFSNQMMDMPLTEVEFRIPLTNDADYVGKFDRIVIDPYNRLWVVDFKTANRIDTTKLENDPQASAYAWSAEEFFKVEFEGVIWVQLAKDVPKGPKLLVNGEFSQNKQAKTTYRLYRQSLMEEFGHIPKHYMDHLNYLAAKETENGDAFIRYDLLRRNYNWKQSEMVKIFQEVYEMRNENMFLYPNPTRDCIWDCAFRSACIALDDGSDYQFILENDFMQFDKIANEQWRTRIEWPEISNEV
jgi:hypothetical protein